MWSKIKSWFGSSTDQPQMDAIKETLAVQIDPGTDINAFVEQFAKAVAATHPIREEFNHSAMFSEHSLDLFIKLCDKLYEMDELDDGVRSSILSQLWIRLAREVTPNEDGVASILDFMKIAQRWHLKVIDKIKTKEPAEYFVFINYLERSLLQTVDVLDSMARVETDNEQVQH